MKNLVMIAAFGVMGSLCAQSTPGTPVPTDAPQAPAPVKSIYDACLTVAGLHTWAALGLNEDQTSRVTALQSRYKEMMTPKEEPKVEPKKAKKQKQGRKEGTVKDAGEEKAMMEKDDAVTSPVEPVEANAADNTKVVGDATAADLDPAPAVPLSVDDELALILTPEQLELWNKRCSSAETTGMVQP